MEFFPGKHKGRPTEGHQEGCFFKRRKLVVEYLRVNYYAPAVKTCYQVYEVILQLDFMIKRSYRGGLVVAYASPCKAALETDIIPSLKGVKEALTRAPIKLNLTNDISPYGGTFVEQQNLRTLFLGRGYKSRGSKVHELPQVVRPHLLLKLQSVDLSTMRGDIKFVADISMCGLGERAYVWFSPVGREDSLLASIIMLSGNAGLPYNYVVDEWVVCFDGGVNEIPRVSLRALITDVNLPGITHEQTEAWGYPELGEKVTNMLSQGTNKIALSCWMSKTNDSPKALLDQLRVEFKRLILRH